MFRKQVHTSILRQIEICESGVNDYRYFQILNIFRFRVFTV